MQFLSTETLTFMSISLPFSSLFLTMIRFGMTKKMKAKKNSKMLLCLQAHQVTASLFVWVEYRLSLSPLIERNLLMSGPCLREKLQNRLLLWPEKEHMSHTSLSCQKSKSFCPNLHPGKMTLDLIEETSTLFMETVMLY